MEVPDILLPDIREQPNRFSYGGVVSGRTSNRSLDRVTGKMSITVIIDIL